MSKENQLTDLYEKERLRLSENIANDYPQGEYKTPVFGTGNVNARVLLIGEAPGAEETKMGMPFVGKAGKQLTEILTNAGMDRTEMYITNVVKYRPVVRKERSTSNRTPGTKEIEKSLPLLKNEIATVHPGLIVTLGNTPLRAICEISGMASVTIGECHGKSQKIEIDGNSYLLVALYHPASAIYNRTLLPTLQNDAIEMGKTAATV